jgi:hypothetical protein
MTWGGDWDEAAPYNLLTYFIDGKPTRKGEEVVVVIKVLPSDVNSGYEAFVNERIVEVNGAKILNLRELMQAVETGFKDSYVVFKTASNKIIALDSKAVEAEHDAILATYEIPNDRSEDLTAEAGGDEMKTDEVASMEHSREVHLR